MRAIVIFASCEGQTLRIAHRIAQTMGKHGVPTDTFDVAKQSVTEIALKTYDAVVLGSSLHYGEHDRRIEWCIREHQRYLAKIPTAFFSVCLGILSKNEQDRHAAEDVTDELLSRNIFNPSRRTAFAGALRYSEYGWLKKRIMRHFAEISGYATELAQDYEYTDWQAVEAFAVDFAEYVLRCRHPDPIGPWPADATRRHQCHRQCVKERSTQLGNDTVIAGDAQTENANVE
ncbi:menaquinone-dependent protoporphyrinogen oxidase [Rhodopirellula rubra]|uniref:Menaquinone-dependent protoporphyrinogen oxidase n=1 Tax=Aporhodopirellula rubra TaxID=980271 RepID=A0A7W5H543_9BACT|nr:flavodoxin domain-containing protein [Aporhodopirellula rubra]MBB3206049.1 menaquinone-dependent protoporphyrinogen oxidase [Aporhodopirellula rubra]